MAKYSYICFVKREKEIPPKWDDDNLRKYNTEHHRICHEMGFRLLFWGESHGEVEDSVLVYESDHGLDSFNEFVNKMRGIEPKWMEYIRTLPVVNVPTNIGVEDKSLHF